MFYHRIIIIIKRRWKKVFCPGWWGPVCWSVTERLQVWFQSRTQAWVAGSVPGQGGYYPWSWCMWEATDRCFSLAPHVSLSPSLPSFLFKKKQWKNVLRWGWNKTPLRWRKFFEVRISLRHRLEWWFPGGILISKCIKSHSLIRDSFLYTKKFTSKYVIY